MGEDSTLKMQASHLSAASKMSHVVSLGPQNFAGIATVGGFSPSYLKDRLLKNGESLNVFLDPGARCCGMRSINYRHLEPEIKQWHLSEKNSKLSW